MTAEGFSLEVVTLMLSTVGDRVGTGGGTNASGATGMLNIREHTTRTKY